MLYEVITVGKSLGFDEIELNAPRITSYNVCYTKLLRKKFRNRTSEHIDTDMITSEIQTKLIKKRIKFIDDALDQDALKEMEKGMTGLIDPNNAIPVGQLKSPNMYLTGDIRDNVRYRNNFV